MRAAHRLQTVRIRQGEVEQHNVDLAFPGSAQGGGERVDTLQLELRPARVGQRFLDQAHVARVVFHQQDADDGLVHEIRPPAA